MNRKADAAATLIIVAAVAVVYHRAASAYFFDDDFQWLVGTWAFSPARLLDFANIRHFYRPVIDLYFAAATPLFSGSPARFHLFNICLHAANGLVLMALAREISGSRAFAFLAALFFVVQPADVDAIAWVSALAEPVGAFFGCLALLWFLQHRRTGSPVKHALSVAAFVLALLTHESSVMFFPLLLLAGWAFADTRWPSYIPYAVALAAYLAIDLTINSRNYVVTGGHYGVGAHAITNLLEYMVAMLVGRHNTMNYALIAIGIVLLLVKGNRRVIFATAWIILALLPFVFFKWSNTSRYMYLPAMGLSMLIAEGVMQIDRLLASRVTRSWAAAAAALIAVVIAGRFAIFATSNVKGFADRTEDYRRDIESFRQAHGALPPHSRVPLAPLSTAKHSLQFLTALVEWEYGDPTIELIPDRLE
jgi:hypothetical protein